MAAAACQSGAVWAGAAHGESRKKPVSSIFAAEEVTSSGRSTFYGAGKQALMAPASQKRGNQRVMQTQAVLADFVDLAVKKQVLTQSFKKQKADPKSVVSIILGGGAGTKLFPLTKTRAVPAVPIGGAYRLIDVPMSNCINSGINKVYVLTQFNSASLNTHLARTYNFGNGVNQADGFVESLSATQTPVEGTHWFQGTADAVRQFAWLFENNKNKDADDIVVLSGDQLYRMDYMELVQKHKDTGADITLSVVPVDDRRASDYGLMTIDSAGRVIDFAEKPKESDLKKMAVDTSILGLSQTDAAKYPYIASMGVYVFKRDILLQLLRWRYPTSNDFGSEIIPASAKEYHVQAHLFSGYWEDVGTIQSFYEANLALVSDKSSFAFFDERRPTYTSPRYLPATQIEQCEVINSIISHGCFLRTCVVENSLVGIRSRLEDGVDLKDTYLVGADFYETDEERAALLAAGKVPVGVGKNTQIRKAIIDKNARIGQNVVIANKENVQEGTREDLGFYIRSGIAIVIKNGIIPDNTVI